MKETIKKLKKEISRLSSLVDYDFLTGLYNRQGFVREAEKFFDELRGEANKKERRKIAFKNFSVIFVDLDNLKVINDKYGHKAGDRALKAAARIFKNSIRHFDIIGRWGGDEFVIGLIGVGEKEALEVAQKMKKNLKLRKINGFGLSASFGIITAINKQRENILNLYELIERADMAMYEAKKNKGKGLIIVH
ncbi:MAG: GGDEF domain-containing protein [Patescibacteria group bacterium]